MRCRASQHVRGVVLIALFILAAAASAAGTATVAATGLTEPSGAIVDPDGHIWVSDGSGFCETTATDGASGTPGTLLATVCDATVSGQPAETADRTVVLMPDGKRQASIHRLKWDASSHSYLADGEIPVSHPIPAAVSIGPDGAAYVGFTRLIDIERIPAGANAPAGVHTDQEVGTSAAARPAGMVAGWDESHSKTVVYIAESKGGVSELDPGAGAVAVPTEFGAATLGATPPQFNALTYDPGDDTLYAATALGAPDGFPDVIASMNVTDPRVQDAAAATGYSNVGGLAIAGGDRILAVDDPSGTGVAGIGRLLETGVADIAAPTTSFAVPFDGVVTGPSASFAFHANEAATFTCRLDAGPFAPCSSPVTFSNLAVGPHTVDVQAIDLAGNPAAIVTRQFVVRAPAAVPPGTPVSPAGSPATPAGAIPRAGVLGANADHAAPRLTLALRGGAARLRGTAITVPFRCNETCVAQARGTISVRGSARLYRLRGASRLLRRGQSGALVVQVPRSALGSLQSALHAGRTVSMRLTLRTEDVAGNATTRTTSVRVRGS